MSKPILLTSLFLLFFAVSCGIDSPQAKETDSSQVKEMNLGLSLRSPDCIEDVKGKCERFGFRWIEMYNYLASSKIRRAEIFMDPSAFNEANLRQLFEHLSRVNPEPSDLIVTVKTDWNQLQPSAPSCPGYGASNMPEPPDKYDYLQATYQRRHWIEEKSWTEYFIYSPKTKVREPEFTKVVIRSPKQEETRN
jgi:hypothetical protein